jgi:beta-phosphoglucomutase
MVKVDFPYAAVIFNLDGVLVDTSVHHYIAWRRLANELGFDFSAQQHESLRGLSRMASLEKILEWGQVYLSEAEKLHLADVKNNWYTQLIADVKPHNVLPAVLPLLHDLRDNGVELALSSASRSARNVLQSTELASYFQVIIDGFSTRKSKPDPECFLLASKALGRSPGDCLVFEDSLLGVKAAIFGAFTVVGVGSEDYLHEAHLVIPGFERFPFEKLAAILSESDIVSSQSF